MINLVWLKRDLRLVDHAPLYQATQGTRPVILLYVHEPQYWQLKDTSARHWQFIRESLCDLNQDLAQQKTGLWIAEGEVQACLQQLHQQFGIHTLFSHEETGNQWTYIRDQQVQRWCATNHVRWQQSRQFAVKRGPVNRDHWDHIWQQQMRAAVVADANLSKLIPPPAAYQDLPSSYPGNDRLFCLSGQIGGCKAGKKLLTSFLCHRQQRYLHSVSSPVSGPQFSSRLSPYLAYGCLSMKEVVQNTVATLEKSQHSRALRAFKSRLHWHCHFIQKLETEPEYELHAVHRDLRPLRSESFDPSLFEAWCEARTGIPFVDACMMMLRHTGWLPFRMRAMLMAFSSYHLWLPWQKPAAFLAQLFTDYEPGIHYPQVQMQSGTTGINPFRIYNPIKQGMRFDPDGQFIRRWLTPLRPLHSAYIHQPWRSPDFASLDYPEPVIDPELSARQARETLFAFYREHVNQSETRRVVSQHASRRYHKKPSRRSQKSTPATQQLSLF
ncbi:FAD-binding domain-containing protein [Lacimicrobium sp. SS2-24]|uniref:FAD-binding domain-containing protein n=1 Tax=Lacimicrobium sp. SS2-24 TaxID=2005569 RepID=UPI000B4B1E2E|nr:FAD-binding domain-containing protein [Lacimicrobium sp. SS2-24]